MEQVIRLCVYLVSLLVFSHSINGAFTNDFFYGAVVEYSPLTADSYNNTVFKNLEQYEGIVKKLTVDISMPASIIVFPESGLQIRNGTEKPHAEPVPKASENVIPCDYNNSPVLKRLSCLAKTYSVYLVINLYELENNDIYNTNVVLDRKGTVVARYRKFNIWGVTGGPITKPKEVDLTFFKTDFDVVFGTFTCFDIVFKTPTMDLINLKNVTHFVFPTGWMSEMPFLSAIQEQAAWARANNVVLLASELNIPQAGYSGSGIYAGETVIKAEQIGNTRNFAILAKIPKIIPTSGSVSRLEYLKINLASTRQPVANERLKLKHDKQLDLYTSQLVEESTVFNKTGGGFGNLFRVGSTTQEKTVCHGEFCCYFSFTYVELYNDDLLNISSISEVPLQTLETSFGEDFSSLTKTNGAFGDDFGKNKYRLAAFDGVRSYANIATGGIQVCSILSCNNNDIRSCGVPTYDVEPNKKYFDSRSFSKLFSGFINVNVTANFIDNGTHDINIMPSVLVSSKAVQLSETDSYFGSVDSYAVPYKFTKSNWDKDNKVRASIIANRIPQVGTLGLYARLFNRDGQNATTGLGSGAESFKHSIMFILSSLLVPLFFYTH